MLNTAAIGLYMIIVSVTGSQAVAGPITSLPTLPEQPVQTLQEKKEVEIRDSITTEAYVKEYFKDIPVLAEVARCESQYRQFDKRGNVIRGKVDNGDIGVMQINERYHGAKAKSLGINLHTLEGNLAYARDLHEREGFRPWLASSPCWSGVSVKELTKRDISSNRI